MSLSFKLLPSIEHPCKTAVLKNSFSIFFFGFPQKTEKRESKNRYLSVEISFRILRSISQTTEHPNTLLPSKFIAKSRPSLRLI